VIGRDLDSTARVFRDTCPILLHTTVWSISSFSDAHRAVPYRLRAACRITLLTKVGNRFHVQPRQERVMNHDQIKGRIKETEGKAKQVSGNAFGNKSMEEKGKTQKDLGKAQANYGDLKKDLKKDA
jgi:uncharacterized protein YjbJ (UPF0337 family)